MCVAIYKPQNVPTPNLDILKACWEANPDGAGFAFVKDRVEIHKGFMEWQEFVKAYDKYNLANYQGELLIHFRVATHGGVCGGNTHPFPLTNDVSLLQSVDVLSNYALIHNGILPITPSQKNISDTMELCKKLANGKFAIPQIMNLLDDLIGNNKIAIMTNKEVYLAGNWKNLNGVYFSNLNWDYFYQDDFFATPFELEFLEQGYCPNCDDVVERYDKEYYCPNCESLWSVQ